MAKKIANPDKLKAEIALQQSKMKSLEILDAEISMKIERLNQQKKALREKHQKLKFACEKNIQKLNGLNGR
jgi:hypothetical protein